MFDGFEEFQYLVLTLHSHFINCKKINLDISRSLIHKRYEVLLFYQKENVNLLVFVVTYVWLVIESDLIKNKLVK